MVSTVIPKPPCSLAARKKGLHSLSNKASGSLYISIKLSANTMPGFLKNATNTCPTSSQIAED